MVLQALRKGEDPRLQASVTVIAALSADVLLITGIDYDLGGQTLTALADRLAEAGQPYPYQLALRPNSGIATGQDLDRNFKTGEPRDAQGYGRFAGEAGMAVLSRLPILQDSVRDFNGFLWLDLPSTLAPPETYPQQRLSSGGHWIVPILAPNGEVLSLLAYYATPPVFDGPEDRNGKRNHDETAFWLRLMNGDLPFAPPDPPFVLLGQSNLDPADGEGLPSALLALLTHPAFQDPEPRSQNPRTDPKHRGDPALDTALYDDLGGLRVELVLPSRDLRVTASGVLWPKDEEPLATAVRDASRHRPVWVEVDLAPQKPKSGPPP